MRRIKPASRFLHFLPNTVCGNIFIPALRHFIPPVISTLLQTLICIQKPDSQHNSRSLLQKINVPCGNRTHNYSLGARDTTVNTYNDQSTQVKEILDFPNYSVALCQNKKTCFHLCKAPFGARPVLGAPGGCNHSVPSSSLSWPPLRFSFVTMITWFSYQINYIITCCRSDVDDFLTIFYSDLLTATSR